MASFLLSHLSAHLRYVSSAYFFTSSKSKGVRYFFISFSAASIVALSFFSKSSMRALYTSIASQLHHLSPHFSLLLPSSLYYRVCRLKESHLVLYLLPYSPYTLKLS